MPRKLSSSAAAVIADAVARAQAEGSTEVREEHLFAALLSDPDGRRLLGGLGGPEGAEAVRAEVQRARRSAGIGAREQEALAELGIDVDELVARVEARLGEGALDATRTSPRRRGRLSMSSEALAVLGTAHKQKRARGDREFTAPHLVLGLVAAPGPFADALNARGITVTGVTEALGTEGARGGGQR